MQLFDKEVAPNIHVKAEIADGKLQIVESLALVAIAGPLLDKIAELIPGHFEDGLIEEAKKKLADLAAQSAAPVA